MGVGAHHDVGAGVDELLGERLLLGVGAGLGLGAPVHVNDHRVGRLAHLLDLRTSWVGSMAEATPGCEADAVHVLTRLLAITWVAEMTAMRWPSMVTR